MDQDRTAPDLYPHCLTKKLQICFGRQQKQMTYMLHVCVRILIVLSAVCDCGIS